MQTPELEGMQTCVQEETTFLSLCLSSSCALLLKNMVTILDACKTVNYYLVLSNLNLFYGVLAISPFTIQCVFETHLVQN